jgi:hypothetical protein
MQGRPRGTPETAPAVNDSTGHLAGGGSRRTTTVMLPPCSRSASKTALQGRGTGPAGVPWRISYSHPAAWGRQCEAVRCRAVDKLLAKADLERIAAPAGGFAGSETASSSCTTARMPARRSSWTASCCSSCHRLMRPWNGRRAARPPPMALWRRQIGRSSWRNLLKEVAP